MARAIKSAKSDDAEIIAVDDHSTDRSREIAEYLAAKDPRIKVVDCAEMGIAAARNTGLDFARGKYVMWCDADDWLAPRAISAMTAAIEESGADFAVCNIKLVRRGKISASRKRQTTNGWFSNKISGPVKIGEITIWRMNKVLWNKIFRLDKIRRESLRFAPLLMSEDVAFVTEYAMLSRKARFIDDKLYNYVLREDSTMGKFYRHGDPYECARAALHILQFVRARRLEHFEAFAESTLENETLIADMRTRARLKATARHMKSLMKKIDAADEGELARIAHELETAKANDPVLDRRRFHNEKKNPPGGGLFR